MLSNTKLGLALSRSVLGAASARLTVRLSPTHQLMCPSMVCQSIVSSRQRHGDGPNESFFDLLDRKPIDQSKTQIDEVIKTLGDRGIKRVGSRVTVQDYFTLFKLDPEFNIEESRLHLDMIRLQRVLHPDKFVRNDKISQVVSIELSSLVNEAYETLRHPYKRALYLLRLRTSKTEREVEADLDKLEMDPAFLETMMQLRETINRGDKSESDSVKLHQELQRNLDELILAISGDFEMENYDGLLLKLGKLKFVANCHIALSDKLEKLSYF